MSIDKSGQWWKGENYDDLVACIKDYTEDGYPAGVFSRCVCECGESSFGLVGSADEGFAKRLCRSCDAGHAICDSQEHWDDELAEEFACPCEAENFELAVGFSMRSGDESEEVRWITLGARCLSCGVLGVYIDWKIDYSPSADLVNQA